MTANHLTEMMVRLFPLEWIGSTLLTETQSEQLHTEVESLRKALNQHNVEYYETKGDLASVLVALGGGVGIAAIIRSVALAIGQYFAGAASLERARNKSLTVTIAGDKIQFTAENAGTAESEILNRIRH